MQKENLFFFSFSSESTFEVHLKGTIKRAKNQILFEFFRAKYPSLPPITHSKPLYTGHLKDVRENEYPSHYPPFLDSLHSPRKNIGVRPMKM